MNQSSESQSASASDQDLASIEYDSLFLNARREAIIIFIVWIVALLWCVPYCYINGYPSVYEPENLKTIMGIPSWLFWGIAFPWLVADIFTVWFCFFYMAEDDLGGAPEDESHSANGEEVSA